MNKMIKNFISTQKGKMTINYNVDKSVLSVPPKVNSKEGELIGVVRKDMVSRKNVFYTCSEMDFEQLEALFGKYNEKL